VMTASAAYLAIAKQQLINIIVGVLTFYLVATGWAAIKRDAGEIGHFEFGALFIALADVACAFLFGWQATNRADGLRDGYPAAVYFVFGSIALLAAALDVNMLIRGGLSGAHRMARHLWRMSFAFLITVLSFFVGKQRLFPDAIVRTHLNAVPVLLVAAVMFYWLFRVLLTNKFKKIQKSSNRPRTPNLYLLKSSLRNVYARSMTLVAAAKQCAPSQAAPSAMQKQKPQPCDIEAGALFRKAAPAKSRNAPKTAVHPA